MNVLLNKSDEQKKIEFLESDFRKLIGYLEVIVGILNRQNDLLWGLPIAEQKKIIDLLATDKFENLATIHRMLGMISNSVLDYYGDKNVSSRAEFVKAIDDPAVTVQKVLNPDELVVDPELIEGKRIKRFNLSLLWGRIKHLFRL